MKNARQNKILEIIDAYEISTQEALIEKLAEYGFDATQTTISRDIRQLNLVKGPTGKGTYKYVAPSIKSDGLTSGHNSVLTEAVLKIASAQNIVVIKTVAGMANAIAVCVDSLHIDGILGSVAGDDTILIVMTDTESAENTKYKLKEIFGR